LTKMNSINEVIELLALWYNEASRLFDISPPSGIWFSTRISNMQYHYENEIIIISLHNFAKALNYKDFPWIITGIRHEFGHHFVKKVFNTRNEVKHEKAAKVFEYVEHPDLIEIEGRLKDAVRKLPEMSHEEKVNAIMSYASKEEK